MAEMNLRPDMIGEDGDVVVLGTHDVEAARASAMQYGVQVMGMDDAAYLLTADAKVGHWRKVPCRTGEWSWWLTKSEPGPGASPGVYFSPALLVREPQP